MSRNSRTLLAAVAGLGALAVDLPPAQADSGSQDWVTRAFAPPITGPRGRARGNAPVGDASAAAGWSGGGETGMASYYWQSQRVASGGQFNPNAMTAAHKTLPFGARVRVVHLSSGRSVTVTINDRGPYVAGRVIDLSRAAAQSLGMTGAGVAQVRIERL